MADIYYCYAPANQEWEDIGNEAESCDVLSQHDIDRWIARADRKWFPNEGSSFKLSPTTENIESQFSRLADEWSHATGHVSSVTDLINDRKYQEIISLGWSVIPYLLTDLERNKRFWFPALAAITGLRPFDPGDANNYRRMTDAWLRWGRRKGLI